ncbi:MAG TPA: hypothetical protein VF146_09135, partial [Bryobacteraceae bacterium]
AADLSPHVAITLAYRKYRFPGCFRLLSAMPSFRISLKMKPRQEKLWMIWGVQRGLVVESMNSPQGDTDMILGKGVGTPLRIGLAVDDEST